ncbi:MAG: hypothetical protein ACLGGV_10330 [Bacteroidia bacterium]
MKKITLSALALFVAALSFNVAAQDNAEKVRERITPLIDGKVSVPEQEELFSSLVFDNDRLVGYKYDVLENNLTAEEFEQALLIMIDEKVAVLIRDGGARRIGVEVPQGIKIPVAVISFDYHHQPFKFQQGKCSTTPRYLCLRHQIIEG